MAKIVKAKLRFTLSDSEDVEKYRLRVLGPGVSFAYTVPHTDFDAVSVSDDTGEIELHTLGIPEGEHWLALTAVDEAGNESDPLEVVALLDFTAPNAPTDGVVVYS